MIRITITIYALCNNAAVRWSWWVKRGTRCCSTAAVSTQPLQTFTRTPAARAGSSRSTPTPTAGYARRTTGEKNETAGVVLVWSVCVLCPFCSSRACLGKSSRFIARQGLLKSHRQTKPRRDHAEENVSRVAHVCGPVRRQLLGAQPGGSGATFSPSAADVPLAAVADACGLLRPPPPPPLSSSSSADDGAEGIMEGGQASLAVENARLRAENAELRHAAAAAVGAVGAKL